MKKVLPFVCVILILGTCVSCKTQDTPDLSLFNTILTAEEALAASKESSVVVFEGMKCTAGQEFWDEFYQRVNQGKSASILCAFFYELDKEHVSEELYEAEKDQYPQLFFYLLEYDGDIFTVTTRQSTEKKKESKKSFPYLMHYTGDAPAQASFSSYEYYVLVDDPTVTWDEIVAGLISSRLPVDGAKSLRHCSVYQNTFD